MPSNEAINVVLFLAAVFGAVALSSNTGRPAQGATMQVGPVPLERKHFWALLCITMAYLAPELAFTVHLLDTAAQSPRSDALHGLDIIGRSLAGIAVSLFVLQYFLSRAQLRMRYGLMALAVSGTLALTFFSLRLPPQAWEDASSGPTRSVAVRCAAVQKGLSQGMLALPGMSFGDSALYKAWLPLTGFMCLHSPSLKDTFLSSLKALTLFNWIAEQRGTAGIHADLQTKVDAGIKGGYESEYLERVKAGQAELEKRLGHALEPYETAREALTQAIELAHKVPHLDAGPERDAAIDQLARLLAKFDPTSALSDEDIRIAKATLNRELPFSLQVSDDQIDRHLAQAISWLAATSKDVHVSPDSSQSGRRQRDAVITALLVKLCLNGAANGHLVGFLPADWNWNDASTLRAAGRRAAELEKDYQDRLNVLEDMLGTRKLNLTLKEFEVLPRVQELARDGFCAEMDKKLALNSRVEKLASKAVRPMPLCKDVLPQDLVFRTDVEMGEEFEHNFVRPIFMPYVEWSLENLQQENASMYADGGKLEKEGREAYRMLVLVPFALFCSLLGASSHLLKLLILSARMGRISSTGENVAVRRSLLQRFSWLLPLAGGLTLVVAMGAAGKPILGDAVFQKLSTAMLAEFDADGHQTTADKVSTHAEVHLVRAVIVGQAGIYRTVTGIRDVFRSNP